MALIASLEKWLEKVIEGVFNRGFKGQIQPIEIAKRLVKEMENNKTISISKVYVPDYYLVYLSQEDGEKIKAFQQALAEELGEYILKQGLKTQYIFLNQPKVAFLIDNNLSLGQLRIESRFMEEKQEASEVKEITDTKIQPVVTQSTQVFSSKELIRATYGELVVLEGPDKGKIFPLNKESMVLGRKNTNEIFLNDSNVSRSHAKLVCKNDYCLIVDLGSTNGTLVNRKIITEKKLENEDIIEVGVTTLMFKVV